MASAAEVKVAIDGVSGPERDNVRLSLSIERYRDLPDLSDGMIQRLHARAPQEIALALRPYGFHEAKVEATLESTGPGQWRARYVIEPGEPLRWREVKITVAGPGAAEPRLRRLTKDRLALGEVARHPDYEEVKRDLLTQAANLGYLDAQFSLHELRVTEASRRAEAHLHLETGEQYQFGPLTLRQDILEDSFLRRYVPFREGEPYALDSLLALHYALSDSEYFTLVSVEAPREQAVGRVIPVTVDLVPRARHRYTFGVGFATDTGPRGTAGWENRRVTTRGHRSQVALELSEVRQTLQGRYVIPLRRPAFERLTGLASWTAEEVGDVDTENFELAIAHTWRKGRWQQTLTPRLLHNRERIDAVVTERTQLVPEAEWVFRRGETGVTPRRAQRLAWSLAASDPALGAATTFVQATMRARVILPAGGERDRWLARAEVGATWADDPSVLGVAQRFLTGGDQSVRGYGYRTLGTQDAAGNVVGGRYLGTVGLEYERWVREPFGLAAFVDGGFAADRWGDDFRVSAGLGFRWRLPFALVAVDVAHPIDHPTGRAVRFHLSLSTDL